MTRPISLRQPAIGAFIRGTLCRIRRPLPGIYANARPGDVVWIREPFHLDAKWNGMAPTAAIGLGAHVTFAADLEFGQAQEQGLGPERAARTLPRAVHRQSARICAVERQRLQAITNQEAQAEGYHSRRDWAVAWDVSLMGFSTKHDSRLWQRDPTVLVLTLDRIDAPLPRQSS